MGGSIQAGGPVTVTEDQEMSQQPDVRYHKGKRIYGGPHNLQLSLDGEIFFFCNLEIYYFSTEYY